jgi:sugar phosphate isomerase/epimerase
MPGIEKLAINQITTDAQWSLREAVEGYARHGVRGICVWRHKLDEIGAGEAARILADHGMTVTGLCRGGGFPASDSAGRQAAIDDNLRAIDDAVAIDAACLVLVVGGLPDGSRDLADARKQVRDGIATILSHARAAEMPLAIEPLHPMICAERGCVNTLAQANDLCDELGDGVGVAVDVYHVWWDPALEAEIARAGRRILAFHVCDWLVPTTDLVFDRGMMGDGVIDIPGIRGWVAAAGYDGCNEVEIFSRDNWWRKDPDEVVRTCIDRHERFV